jgi:hypothetical protein
MLHIVPAPDHNKFAFNSVHFELTHIHRINSHTQATHCTLYTIFFSPSTRVIDPNVSVMAWQSLPVMILFAGLYMYYVHCPFWISLKICFISPDDILDRSSANGAFAIAVGHEVFAAHEADAHVATLVEDRVCMVIQADETVGVVDWLTMHFRRCLGCCSSTSCRREEKLFLVVSLYVTFLTK